MTGSKWQQHDVRRGKKIKERVKTSRHGPLAIGKLESYIIEQSMKPGV